MARAPQTTARTTASAADGAPDPDTKVEDVSDTTTSTANDQAEPEKHDHDYFVTNARVLFREEPETVLGALVHAPRKNLTDDEAKVLVKDHLKRDVTIEHVGQDTE